MIFSILLSFFFGVFLGVLIGVYIKVKRVRRAISGQILQTIPSNFSDGEIDSVMKIIEKTKIVLSRRFIMSS